MDILADENTKIFISHCGNHGAHEALFNGVPILGIRVSNKNLIFKHIHVTKFDKNKLG